MRRQATLPLEGDLTLDQVIGAYRLYMATPLGQLHTASLYRDMILLSTSLGDVSGAMSILRESLGVITDESAFRHVGGRAVFERSSREAIANPDLAKQTIESQIRTLAVGHLPVSRLLR
jgi:hypothetical protein